MYLSPYQAQQVESVCRDVLRNELTNLPASSVPRLKQTVARCLVSTGFNLAKAKQYALGITLFQLTEQQYNRGREIYAQGVRKWQTEVQCEDHHVLLRKSEREIEQIELISRRLMDNGKQMLASVEPYLQRCVEFLWNSEDAVAVVPWAQAMLRRSIIVERVHPTNVEMSQDILKRMIIKLRSFQVSQGDARVRFWLGHAHNNLGKHFRRIANFLGSTREFEKAVEVFESLGRPCEKMMSRISSLNSLLYLGVYSEYRRSLSNLREEWNEWKKTEAAKFVSSQEKAQVDQHLKLWELEGHQEQGVTGRSDHIVRKLLAVLGDDHDWDPKLGDDPSRKNLVAKFRQRCSVGSRGHQSVLEHIIVQQRKYHAILSLHQESEDVRYQPQAHFVVGSMFMLDDPKVQLEHYLTGLELFRKRWQYIEEDPCAMILFNEKLQFIADMCIARIWEFWKDDLEGARLRGWTDHLALDLADIRNAASQVVAFRGAESLASQVNLPSNGTFVVLHLSKDCALHEDRVWRWVVRNGQIIHWDFRETVHPVQQILSEFYGACVAEKEHWRGAILRGLDGECLEQGKILSVDRGPGEEALALSKPTHEVSFRLFQLLFEGLMPFLPDDPEENIVVVPDRDLLLTPFACLVEDLSDVERPYFIERHTFSISTSLRMSRINATQKVEVERVRKGLRRPIRAVAIGDTMCCSGCWAWGKCRNCKLRKLNVKLSNSRYEIRAFVEAMNSPRDHDDGCADETAVLVGESATSLNLEHCIKELHPRYVLVSAHGLNNDVVAKFGERVQLPGGKIPVHGGDEILASDLQEWDLSTVDVVYLNACQGARGVLSPDGVSGFHSSIFAAGCPSCICACWNVNDRAGFLVGREWAELISGPMTKAQALRHALLNTRKRYEQDLLRRKVKFPISFWAGFQLYGNPS